MKELDNLKALLSKRYEEDLEDIDMLNEELAGFKVPEIISRLGVNMSEPGLYISEEKNHRCDNQNIYRRGDTRV